MTPTKLLNCNMLLLWQGHAVSALGNALYSLAIGIWVFEKTGSTALMGTMSSISYFASLVLQPFGGVLADRLDRRAVLVAADAVRGAAMLWLAFFAWHGTLAVWQVLAVAAVAAVCNITFNPAAQSAMTALVPPRELLRASSLLSGTNAVINLAGNAACGFLVVAFGVPVMILLNGISYTLSAITELFLQIPPHGAEQPPLRPAAVLREMTVGLRYLRHKQGVLPMLLAGAAVNLFCGGFSGVVYAWCLQKGMTVPQYGLFLAVEGGVLQSIFYVAAMACHGFWACTLLYGANAFFNAITNMLLLPAALLMTEENYRGRVIALFSACADGGMALSMLGYGVLSQRFGVQTVALCGAVLTLLPSALYYTNKTLRQVLAEGE